MLYIIKTIVSSYSNDDLLESFHQHLECLIFLVVSINVFLLKKEQQKINISKNCTHISIFMKILFFRLPRADDGKDAITHPKKSLQLWYFLNTKCTCPCHQEIGFVEILTHCLRINSNVIIG